MKKKIKTGKVSNFYQIGCSLRKKGKMHSNFVLLDALKQNT